MGTRAGQKPSEPLLSICMDFKENIREKFLAGDSCKTALPPIFENMDETVELFELKLKSTIHCRRDKTVSVSCSKSGSKRATERISAAFEGPKMPLLVVFNGQAVRRTEKSLEKTLLKN